MPTNPLSKRPPPTQADSNAQVPGPRISPQRKTGGLSQPGFAIRSGAGLGHPEVPAPSRVGAAPGLGGMVPRVSEPPWVCRRVLI